VDTHDKIVVHRAFRRKARLLAELITAVPAVDRRRARIRARHLRWHGAGLTNHHLDEDELIWPLLRTRIDGALAARMEQQQEQVAEPGADTFRSAGVAGERRHLRTERTRQRPAARRSLLVSHLDDEEKQRLSLAGRSLTQPEWDPLGEHFVRTTPKNQLLIFLGAVLEDTDAAERAALLGAMPLGGRLVWHTVGHCLYSRRIRRVRSRSVG
jgi:hypothetical protein